MGRHDSYHRIGFAHQLNGLADDRPVTVIVMHPELVTQHDDGLWILAVGCVSRKEVPPEQCGAAQHLEYVAGEVVGRSISRTMAAGDGRVPAVKCDAIFE